MAHTEGCTAGNKHSFYAYMFEGDKKPTPQLDALLRGIAHYIIEEVGDKQVKTLTPAKLASFYKAVGGNYDALFVDIPHGSLSYIYASTGCEHSLQPTGDNYAPPTIPALTIQGFSRWQSIEILLGPEEHVPFMQKAVKNFAIRNPENKELFPPVLPREVFPLHPDADVERWHSSCAEKLRQEATPDEEEGPSLPSRRPKVHVQAGYTHIPAPRPTRNTHNVRDYFASTQFPPIRRVRPIFNRNSSFHPNDSSGSPRVPSDRRRSFPENSSSPNLTMPSPGAPETLKPPVDERNRRHSHPRRQRTPSASSASSDDKTKQMPSKDVPIMGVGGRHKPLRRHLPHPQDQPPPIRYNMPPNLRPEPDSPNRSNSHSSSNSHGGAGSRHSRNTSDNDSLRERRRAHNHAHLSMDSTGQLSAPFMQAHSSSRPVSSRSNSGVRRPPRSDLNIDNHHPSSRRASVITVENEDDDNTESLAYHRKREERSERSKDRGKTDRKRREKMRERELRDRERDRELEREKFEKDRLERGRVKERDGVGGFLSRSASIGAAKLGLKFRGGGGGGGAHEKEEREDRREIRERGRDRDRSRERREYRDRERRGEYVGSGLGSPGRGGDARRYPTDGVIRR